MAEETKTEETARPKTAADLSFEQRRFLESAQRQAVRNRKSERELERGEEELLRIIRRAREMGVPVFLLADRTGKDANWISKRVPVEKHKRGEADE